MALKMNPAHHANPYADHLTAKPAVAMVSQEKKKAGEEWKGAQAESENVTPPILLKAELMHVVTVEGSMTINLGNYESAKIGVVLSVPCVKEDVDAAYEWASDWISERIKKAVSQAKGEE